MAYNLTRSKLPLTATVQDDKNTSRRLKQVQAKKKILLKHFKSKSKLNKKKILLKHFILQILTKRVDVAA
jgi:hypothetical protein